MLVIVAVLFGIGYMIKERNNYMETYAAEHNCKWDYNELCYTKEQKPWLFNK